MYRVVIATIIALVMVFGWTTAASAMDVDLSVAGDDVDVTVTVNGDEPSVTLQGVSTEDVLVNGDPVVTRGQLAATDQYARDAFSELRSRSATIEKQLADVSSKLQVTIDALAKLIVESARADDLLRVREALATLQTQLDRLRTQVGVLDQGLQQESLTLADLELRVQALQAVADQLPVVEGELEDLATVDSKLRSDTENLQASVDDLLSRLRVLTVVVVVVTVLVVGLIIQALYAVWKHHSR